MKLSVKEYAARFNLSERDVRLLCSKGKVSSVRIPIGRKKKRYKYSIEVPDDDKTVVDDDSSSSDSLEVKAEPQKEAGTEGTGVEGVSSQPRQPEEEKTRTIEEVQRQFVEDVKELEKQYGDDLPSRDRGSSHLSGDLLGVLPDDGSGSDEETFRKSVPGDDGGPSGRVVLFHVELLETVFGDFNPWKEKKKAARAWYVSSGMILESWGVDPEKSKYWGFLLSSVALFSQRILNKIRDSWRKRGGKDNGDTVPSEDSADSRPDVDIQPEEGDISGPSGDGSEESEDYCGFDMPEG